MRYGSAKRRDCHQCAPVSVIAVEPSEGFLEKAREQLGSWVLLRGNSAAEIPLHDSAVDVTVSGLVLNFVPNGRAAVSEMARVIAPGGTIAAYVWDYSGKMELMRYFWDAAVELDPEAAKLDEGSSFSSVPSGGAHRTFCQRRAARRPSDGNRHHHELCRFRRLLAAVSRRPRTGSSVCYGAR